MGRRQDRLFDEENIRKYCEQIKITDDQKDAAIEWFELLKNNKLESEENNRSLFEKIILNRLLGYDVYDYTPEKYDVDYFVEPKSSHKTLCVEIKGTSTPTLDSIDKNRPKEKETPIKQTWNYMSYLPSEYGICTNFKEFAILLGQERTYRKSHRFNFNTVVDTKNQINEIKLKEFIGLFSKNRIFIEGILEVLIHEITNIEEKFTEEFYKLYHETRLMLIKEFSKNKSDDESRKQAIHFAQIFMNRLIFIFFVEDHNFIPQRIFTTRILHELKSPSIDENSHLVFDNILDLFEKMNSGSKTLGINEFNGGLFAKKFPSEFTFLDSRSSDYFKEEFQNSKLKLKSAATDVLLSSSFSEQINPIIKNLLIIDSYDFTSDANVNILGHIFEQSISDIEKLSEGESTKRKKFGVFYTPDHITDYICRNTIIPYLSKKNSSEIDELIEEYLNNLEDLENKIKKLQILDPACGSGAFLVKAVDVLLEIYEEIQKHKPSKTNSQKDIDEFAITSEINYFIENNIYGVDLNEESVEITKLSLFLKLAGNDRKLSYLSNNIKLGNSVVDDEKVNLHAFKWSDEFPEILSKLKDDDAGFDIIVGNPPYVNTLYLENEKEYYSKKFVSAYGGYDIYVLFVELGLKLLKKSGMLGYIMSNKFIVSDYGIEIRKIITNESEIDTIVDLADAKRVFPDALVSPIIITLKKIKPRSTYSFKRFIASKSTDSLSNKYFESIPFEKLISSNGTFNVRYTSEKDSIYNKINCLKKFGDSNMFDVRTGIMGFEYWKMAPYVHDGKLSEKDIQIATNSYIDQYHFLWGKSADIYKKKFYEPYANIDQIPINKNTKNLFLKEPKILVRGVAQRLSAVLDYNGVGLLVAVHSIISNNNFDPRFVVSLLNSKFYNWMHKDRFYLGRIPEGSLKYPVSFLKELPIPNISTSDQKPFCELIDSISSKSSKKHQIIIDCLKTFKTKYSIQKISEKLESFHTIDFNVFHKEIERLSRKKLQLSELEDLEKYFSKNKTELNVLINGIDETQKIIDEKVFSLFNLNSTEKKLIEYELENY